MKTTIILLSAALMLLINTNELNGQQWLTTGNTTAGTEKLGSSSGNFNLDFYINNTNWMSLLTSGDLNIVQPSKGYKIDSEFVLWHNNIPSNIFVGVGTGSTGTDNTFVGSNTAGNLGNTGTGNSFIGSNAGFSNTSGVVMRKKFRAIIQMYNSH